MSESFLHLSSAQLDRACGAVLGSAIGDALGAAYEFDLRAVGPQGPQMLGGGLGDFAPGEWTDDTTMAWCVLDVAAKRLDLRDEEGLTGIAQRFRTWFDTGPADIGNQTRAVLSEAGSEPTGWELTLAARDLHARTGHTAGNGSLMRTGPVALPYLDEPRAIAQAARAVSALTHYDPRAQEACVLWSLAIRHAIVNGELDVRVGLEYLDGEAAAFWSERIDEAEQRDPGTFRPNGWVVTALQAAWSAIAQTAIPEKRPKSGHFRQALATAIRIGHDTDTVAAIAGALLGARYGASAIPAKWRRVLHGYPGLDSEDLVHLAHIAAHHGPMIYNWPVAERIEYADRFALAGTLVRHPHDDGVWLSDAAVLDDLPPDVSAVVSLCLVGREQIPPHLEHIAFRLIDTAAPEANLNLDFVLRDAASTIADLRSEGHTVLVHCVAAQSRTPTVAAAYAMLRGVERERALREVIAALPAAAPNPGFRAALESLTFS